MVPEVFKSGKVQMHHVALLHVQQCIMLDCQNLSILHLWTENTQKNEHISISLPPSSEKIIILEHH